MLLKLGQLFSGSLVQFLCFAIAIYLLGSLIIKLINRQVADLRRRHSARKITLYTTVLTILGVALVFWLESIEAVAVVISIVGAGLVVALQESILCFAGWLLIIFKHPFTVGDRVEIGTVKGDVIDVRMFQTALLEVGNWVEADQSTGRVVHVPNSSVFKERLFNYTKGFEFVWNEIKITVTFESNWQKAKQIILQHANPEIDKLKSTVQTSIDKMAQEYMIHYEKFTPIVYVNIAAHGIELNLRYLTGVRQRRNTQDRISQSILEDFAGEKDIHFAYPTYRIVK
ncbi:MAG: mechanosensitive ion channel family protein [Candidatus Omnitrophica bacterium]|nr:mechanosensitive ion channel family protein [Candidatus Omnitrophota bacterium]